MSYPRIDCSLRTDESFRNQSDSSHHRVTTPLIKLPIDMVADFVIADSLHLLELGVMKRCLMGWARGSLNKISKWSTRDKVEINLKLQSYNAHIPKEFHRAVRTLDTLSFWKAIEFRKFLLYLGPVVLKDFLQPNIYKNFLQLFCAVTICSTDIFSHFLHIADSLFKDFIEGYIQIYGKDTISTNVHNLCHVVDDVRKFGNLTKISAYPYENTLYSLKLLLRSGNKPLVQIAKRSHEMLSNNSENASTGKGHSYPFAERETKSTEATKTFACFHLKAGTTFINNNKNKWFLTKKNEIVKMINAEYCDNELFVNDSAIKRKTDFFNEPFQSSLINLYISVDGDCYPPKFYQPTDIKCKLMCLNYQNQKVFLPILHTYT